MAGRRYALLLSLVGLLPAVAWGQTSLTPQAGMLLLRNGHILEGEITRAGDYYIITQGQTSEIRMRADDVEALCGSLGEAYEFKARHLSGGGPGPHLNLAEWCLRHNLHARCAEQLVAAMQLEPENPRLLLLEQRLALAVEEPPPVSIAAPATVAAVGTEQLDKTIRGLPKESVERFATVVQPILLNRCAAGNCHGPTATSEFRLLKPPMGQAANQRFTQRNLYAALQQIDRSDPQSSPLLTLPQGRHGTALAAVFDGHSQKQLDELKQWVKLATAQSPAPPPATIGPAQTILSQAATGVDGPSSAPPAALPASETATARPLAPGTEGDSVQVMRPPLDAADQPSRPTTSPPPTPGRFTPRDRYDAEIFNRRYHAK
jgi:hypothetical protein